MKYTSIIFPLLAAATLSSCSKQAAPDSNFPQDHVIRVQAGVLPSTKGSYDSSNLYEFAFYSINFDAPINVDSKYKYSKKCSRSPYSFPGYVPSWEWDGDAPLWRNSDDRVGMIAIAPVPSDYQILEYDTFDKNNGGSGYTFGIQTAQSSSDKGSDLLGWYKVGLPSIFLNENGNVPIEFQHLLSKLNLTFVLGTEFNAFGIPSSDIVSDVVISGTRSEANVSIVNYGLTATASGSATDIKPYNTAWTPGSSMQDKCSSSWECILVPDSNIDITVSFKVNGTSYVSTLTGKTLEQGKAYNQTITVGSDVVSPSSLSVAAWVDGVNGSLITE